MIRRLLAFVGRLLLGAAFVLVAIAVVLCGLAGYLIYRPLAALPPRKRGLLVAMDAFQIASVLWQMRHDLDGNQEGVDGIASELDRVANEAGRDE